MNGILQNHQLLDGVLLTGVKVNPLRASAATLAATACIAASIEIHCDAPKSAPNPFQSVTLYTMDPMNLTLDA